MNMYKKLPSQAITHIIKMDLLLLAMSFFPFLLLNHYGDPMSSIIIIPIHIIMLPLYIGHI